MSKILIVEDESDISDLITLHLTREGHETHCVANGLQVQPAAVEQQPDLIVLDMMLPGLDGGQVFKRLRADTRTTHIPIIILTAKSQVVDKIAGLELGADDYLTKPFSPRELYLRISAILRRVKKVTHVSEVRRGRFLIDRKSMKVYLDGSPLDLTTTEFKLLTTLMENDTAVHTRADLLREVWGYNSDVATRTLDTHVKRLREKLGAAGSHIVTVRGTGFQFDSNPPGLPA
ncbi:MAG: response regulator transcription factor [Prosthecobacter sp.]|jgi:two-component system phosphate regulon response regulator PhoB|uniref:response regulator transcription factor n=1 Tax=Prosthecobacter sp. TaxID=1965333 RepID=UPI0019D9B05D|nr:response regulator transcription factor [Prosthecobacter sp.]MBE2283141.1 response regulator transcription factor [Prosthecobacter sp.]